MAPFDPDAAAVPGSGIFGLPHGRADADLVLVQAPCDVTTSGRGGAAAGPATILAASHQVDLFDLQTGRPYERGIHLLPDTAGVGDLSREARARALPLIERGGVRPRNNEDAAALAEVNAACARVDAVVHDAVAGILDEGKIPGVIGGDHAVAFGGIRAVAERFPGVGVLQLDAHADLRPAYEGFRWSHASIMHNVLAELSGVARIVQVGVRDLSGGEMEAIRGSEGRVVTHFDLDWQSRLAEGTPWAELCREAVDALPQNVHVSFDIDGLDPSLCPGTGTPVPGGLSFSQACLMLAAVASSGRRIVGFDLTEVAPSAGGDDIDGCVGARLLYKLCGFALLTG